MARPRPFTCIFFDADSFSAPEQLVAPIGGQVKYFAFRSESLFLTGTNRPMARLRPFTCIFYVDSFSAPEQLRLFLPVARSRTIAALPACRAVGTSHGDRLNV